MRSNEQDVGEGSHCGDDQEPPDVRNGSRFALEVPRSEELEMRRKCSLCRPTDAQSPHFSINRGAAKTQLPCSFSR